MSVLVNKPAPEFSANAVMPDGSEKEVSLSDYKGKYVVLFFYPKILHLSDHLNLSLSITE